MLVGFVPTDQASGRGTEETMVGHIVACGPAHDGAFEAAFGVCRASRGQDQKCNGRKRDDGFHDKRSFWSCVSTIIKSAGRRLFHHIA
jgi:hypothetical protein